MRCYQPSCDDCGAVGASYVLRWHAESVARSHDCSSRCLHCGFGRAVCRGLCSRCYYNEDIRLDYEMRLHRVDALIEDVEWLITDDATLTIACDRLHIQRDTLWRALRRAGRLDLWDRLMDLSPHADMSRALRRSDLRVAS